MVKKFGGKTNRCRQSGTKSNPPNLILQDEEEETPPQDTPQEDTPQNTPENVVPENKQEEPEIDHDALVNYIFLAAIKTKIKDKDLPILFNNFWSNYMLPCRPDQYLVDIKKTKYKKVK
jgi:hypothetical protein